MPEPDQLLVARIRLKRLATRGDTPAADLADWIESEFGWRAEHGTRPDGAAGSWNRLPSGKVLDSWRSDRDIIAVDPDGFMAGESPPAVTGTEEDSDAPFSVSGDTEEALPAVSVPDAPDADFNDNVSDTTEPEPQTTEPDTIEDDDWNDLAESTALPSWTSKTPANPTPANPTPDDADIPETSPEAKKPNRKRSKDKKPNRNGRRLLTRIVGAILAIIVVLSLIPAIGAATGTFGLLPVRSASMEPDLDKGSLAFVTPVEARTLNVNDVIAFDPPSGGDDVIHSVATKDNTDNGVLLTTQGTANPNPDPWELNLDDNEDVLVVRTEVPAVGWALVALTSSIARAGLAAAAVAFAVLAIRAARKERQNDLHGFGSVSDEELSGTVSDWLGSDPDDDTLAEETPVNA